MPVDTISLLAYFCDVHKRTSSLIFYALGKSLMIFTGYFSAFKALRSEHSELCDRSSNAEGQKINQKINQKMLK